MKQPTIQEIKSDFTEQIQALERVEEYLTFDGLRLLYTSREILAELEQCTTIADIIKNNTITIARERLVNDSFINRFNIMLERTL